LFVFELKKNIILNPIPLPQLILFHILYDFFILFIFLFILGRNLKDEKEQEKREIKKKE
jgi:hypothetical protein